METSPITPVNADAAYFQWAESVARKAFEEAGSRSGIVIADLGKGWPARRQRSARDALIRLNESIAALARSESLGDKPSVEFLEDERANPEDRSGGFGVLSIGSVRQPFWPVDRLVAYHEGYEDAAPREGSPDLKPHRSKVAATFFFRIAAEMLIAHKAARAAFMQWARLAADEARFGAGPWKSAHARYERGQLESMAQPPCETLRPRRPRL